jgi:hypothetical protein
MLDRHYLTTMFPFTAVITLLLLVPPATAGSRKWEPSIDHARGNTTSQRAVSVQPGEGQSGTRLWPDKILTYAFADTASDSRLKAMFLQGAELWGELKNHGFSYKEIALSNCKSNRDSCLLVNYNDKGELGCSVARPPVNRDAGYDGPIMHISDSFAVGNREPISNIAHEIGHAWGLFHEHQNYLRWQTSPEHENDSGWGTYTGDLFPTNKFKCENLKDYEEKLAEAQELGGNNAERMCTSYATAHKLGFSAQEWLPVDLSGKRADAEFDPDSLMLYPSKAGGKGDADETSDDRTTVMTYSDGSLIPRRTGPSPMDIAKLVELYGDSTRDALEPLNKKGGKWANKFKTVRADATRAGSDRDGLC